MKPKPFNATATGFRFATDEEARKAKVNGSLRGAMARASNHHNRADALLKRFD